MRNIFIIEESINKMGGVERIVSFLANNFAKSKHYNVNVVSIYRDGNIPFFKYSKYIKIRYFCSRKSKTSILKNRLLYCKNILRIRKFCKNIKTDDIIIFGRTSVAVKFIPFINKDIKIIVRDAINYFGHSKIEKQIMIKYFAQKVNTFIVSSDESKEGYKKHFNFTNVNMIKIYNPLAINTNNSNEYSFDNKEILSVGRYDIQKGFENLIKAFSIVLKKHNDWKLRIVGDGELKETYEKQIKLLNINNNVILEKSTKNIEQTYKKASIFVLTSRYEGYANALVEALACGIPAISYDWIAGIDEILKDGINGKIVKLTNRVDYYYGIDNNIDIDNLASAINEMIENKTEVYKMHEEAKKISISRDCNIIFNRWKGLIDNEYKKK